MGVGAAIASGSQGEKGNRALFVMNVKTSRDESHRPTLEVWKNHLPLEPLVVNIRAIESKKKQSPRRFIKRVKIPDVIEF